MSQATILFVDDDPNVLEGAKVAFRREPYRVLTAESADQALALFEHELIDVVIADEKMPGLLGSELLSVVRQRYPHTIRMIMTGEPSPASAFRSYEHARVTHYLTKPRTHRHLAEAIESALVGRRLS
jgi:DNA-binding NtrC family response regulator